MKLHPGLLNASKGDFIIVENDEESSPQTVTETRSIEEIFREGSSLQDNMERILGTIAIGALPSSVWAEEMKL